MIHINLVPLSISEFVIFEVNCAFLQLLAQFYSTNLPISTSVFVKVRVGFAKLNTFLNMLFA